MKKLVSLGLALAMCGCLTLSACAVQTEDAPKASDDPKNTVDTFVDSGEDSADTDIETFANSAGSTEIKEAYGTITLSNPILYTISVSDLGKIDMSSMEAIVEGMPYDENTFGCPAIEYPSRYMWPSISAVYAVPEGTTVTFPSDIVTATVFELDVTVENGACRVDELNVFIYPGFNPLPLPGNGYILTVELENTAIAQDTSKGGSAIGDNIAGKIAFYVPADTTAANPFGSSAPAAPVTPSAPAAPSTPTMTGSSAFTDVAADSPFKDAIAWAVEKGITNGTTPTTFGPGNTCTIRQILTFLCRANTQNSAATLDASVAWAVEQDMISEDDDTTAPCTRMKAVAFMWQAAGSPEADASKLAFTDVAADAAYAQAVAWAVENGITTGKTDGTFAPGEVCTRGQIVTFLYRAFK